MRRGRVVIKFGGEDLSTPERVRRAARLVATAPWREKVVVVSAIGRTTDQLAAFLDEVGSRGRAGESAEILSMGERTAARIFASALRSEGVAAIVFDPAEANWPIRTDARHLSAEVDLRATRTRVRRHLAPLLRRAVPVVCGFLGRAGGEITTLGRGGSDTTAIVLANCLGASDIVLVKATEGIHEADPRVVPRARAIPRLSLGEMFALAHGGARIVRSESLRYKLPRQRLRIVPLSSRSLAEGGTEIVGSFDPVAPLLASRGGLAAVTGTGRLDARGLARAARSFGDREVAGLATGGPSVTFFVASRGLRALVRALHRSRAFRAIATQDGVGSVSVTHPSFVDTPGAIAKVSSLLFSKNVNIIEMTTSKATITVFLPEREMTGARRLLAGALAVGA